MWLLPVVLCITTPGTQGPFRAEQICHLLLHSKHTCHGVLICKTFVEVVISIQTSKLGRDFVNDLTSPSLALCRSTASL